MKKRLFTTLLLLCLLVAALTATVAASAPATPSFTHTDITHADKSILFTFEAYYLCEGNLKTPVTLNDGYTVTNINSWTSTQIEFQINVPSVRCAGDSSIPHNTHSHEVVHPSKRVTFSGEDLCHKTLELTTKIQHVVYETTDDALEFTVTSETPRYTLTKHLQADPTCTEYGYSDDCYECPECKKLFKDQNAEQELSASVRLDMTPHDYVNGKCKDCGATGEAYTHSPNDTKTYYDTVEAALAAAYNDPDNLSVWITHYERTADINLTNSCNVYVCNGVTIPKICTSASDSQTAINITNHGTIGAITPASSGAQSLEITNQGSITQIDIPDNGSLRMEITNNKDAVINTIQRQSYPTVDGMYVTIQNNGKIKNLYGKKPFKLLSGTGEYVFITTERTGSKLCELLDDGCKFYLPSERSWFGSASTWLSTNNSIVSTPPFSVAVTGPNGLQLDESGSYSLTLAAKDVQNQTLTASLSYPNANTSLSSEGAKFTYGWYYTGFSTAKWTTAELPLNKLAVGVNRLTLQVTDSEYKYTHSINVTVTITSDALEPIYLKVPEGPFTKMYDGTDSVPENLTIGFVDSKGNTVPLAKDTDYAIITEAYNSPNCKTAESITVTVKLTTGAAELYNLEGETFTVDGTITKFKPEGTSIFFYLKVSNRKANVGERIMDYLTEQNVAFEYWDSTYQAIPNPLNADPDITYYRMRTDGIYDPTTDEKITENSIFAYEGDYKIYAVVGETENYAELFTDRTTLTARSASDSHTHCRYGHSECSDEPSTYTAFTESLLSPDGSQNQRSYYLNAAKSTVNLTLILRQLRDSSSENPSLDLCLYGKTLRADSEYAEQFRVSNKWHLTLTDCVGTGILKGTSVNDEYGGCLYVADATVDISNIKITGGSSSKLGGAIVVDKDGTLNLYSGEISGNHVTSGKGGAIYIKSGGVVNIYGGMIKDNHVYSGNGGAIYVEKGGTLNLYGGTITGNTASGLGGGIYVEAGGRVNIQGAPVVTDNTASGKARNVYVCADSSNPLLTISDDMTDGAKLGVSTDAPYPVLLANREQDYSAYFTPDDPDAFVLFSGSALTLCAKPSATLEGDTLTVKTGKNYKPDAFVLFVAEYGADGRLLAVHSEKITAESGTYTFKVQPGATIKCFLLHADTYAPLFAAFSPKA